MAGRRADQWNLAELPETGLATLASLLDSEVSELRKHLVQWHQHDWKNDIYSLGSYTYVPRGAIQASDELSVPVEKTLFFAGEHTDTSGHWGTVHGALRSAYRVAEQVLLARRV
jgi:monoamine oxidase